MEIALPTLDEIEAYYAALPGDAIAATCHKASECLLANPIAARLPSAMGKKVKVSISPPEQYATAGAVVWLFDRALGARTNILANLSEGYNALAWEFDRQGGHGTRVTAADCLAFIRAFRQEYGI